MDVKQLGFRIKFARERRQITLAELAQHIGLNKSTLSRYEHGEIETPKLPVIQAIAEKLAVNPNWLVGKDENMSYTPSGSSFELFSPCNLFSTLSRMREALGYSLDEVAFAIGISSSDYAKIESGSNTDCVTLAKIALFYCCSTDYALSFDGVFAESSNLSFAKTKIFPLHQAFGALSEEKQNSVIEYANDLLQSPSTFQHNYPSLTSTESELIRKFRKLDARGQSAVLNALDHEYAALPGDTSVSRRQA